MQASKVPNQWLVEAGLWLMEQNGQPLQRLEAKGRAMLYRAANGQTVRIRTCNDHVLIAVADSPQPDATLNIEGTDNLLIVMPELPRTPGPVVAYFLPTTVAVEAVRSNYTEWLASNPSTKGENRTRAIWFDYDGPGTGFAKKWATYRLQGSATSHSSLDSRVEPASSTTSLGEVIAEAKRRIAAVAGIPVTAVRITLET